MRLNRNYLLALLLFLWAFVLYLLTMSTDYSHDSDVIRLALDIEGYCNGISYPFIHQGWVPFGRFIWNACRLLGYQGGSFLPMQVFSALAGAISVFMLFLFLRALRVGSFLSFLVAACYSVSWYLLSFSSDNRFYSLGLLLSILILWLLLLPEPARRSAVVTAGALSGLLLLSHIGFYYLLPVAVVIVLMRGTSLKIRVGNLLVFISMTGLIFFAGTLLATNSLRETLSFFNPAELHRIWSSLNQILEGYFIHYRKIPLSVLATYFWGIDLAYFPGSAPFSALYKAFVVLICLSAGLGFALRAREMFRERESRVLWVSLALWFLISLLSGLYLSPLGNPNVCILLSIYLAFGVMARPMVENRFIRPVLYVFLILFFSGMLLRGILSPTTGKLDRHPDPDWPEARGLLSLTKMTGEDVLLGSREIFGAHVAYLSKCRFIDISRRQMWQPSGISHFSYIEGTLNSILGEKRRVFLLVYDDEPSKKIFDEISQSFTMKEYNEFIYQVLDKEKPGAD
ncbi:MAG: hypothetical protein V2A78_10800 [bacterium]